DGRTESRAPRPGRANGRAPRRQDRSRPLSLSALRWPAAARLDHAGAGGGTGDPLPRRAVLRPRLRDDAVHARTVAAHLHGNRNAHRAGLPRPRGGGLPRRSCAAAVAPSRARRRLRPLRNAAPARRRHALAGRLRDHEGALPRNLPARGAARMSRLDPYLPVLGVAGLILLWYIAV